MNGRSLQAVDKIEEVDVVWKSGPLHEAFPPAQLDALDAVRSSRSLEHIPDAVSVLQSFERLLSPPPGPIGAARQTLLFRPLRQPVFERATSDNTADCHDFHAWKLTPGSFAPIIEKLSYLGIMGLEIAGISEMVGHEFFVELWRNSSPRRPDPAAFQAKRLRLLRGMMIEIREQTDGLVALG